VTIEWRTAFERLLAGGGNEFRGHDGIRRFWREYRESWEYFRVAVVELRDLGDRVLLLGSISARGKEGGVDVDSPGGSVVTLRDGKVVRSEDYLSHAEALEAVGLRE
jgi:ketosteroid isomerase-like protein